MVDIDLFRRSPENPILTADAWPYPASAVFNPGACIHDGLTVLMVRVEDATGMSHLTVARSGDGIGHWRIDPEPTLSPDSSSHPEEASGMEDPRITWLEERGEYAVAYTAFSPVGPLVSLATTRDFASFTRLGPVLAPYNKDAAILPRRIGGRWIMIHRPSTSEGAYGYHVWIAESPDLVHWGAHRPVLMARSTGWWDASHIGLGPPAVETQRGWLLLYHGVRRTVSGSVYRVGAALLDLQDPSVLTHRTDGWIMAPRESYERTGDVPNVVFPCGWTRQDDTLRVYYGGADSVVCVAEASIASILDALRPVPPAH